MSITEFILMNSTNSPYESMMKEVPRYKKPAPQKALGGSPCAGELIGGGSPVFPAIESTSKRRADMLAFGPKRRPVCKGF